MKYYFADVLSDNTVRAYFTYVPPEVGPPVYGVPDPQLDSQIEGRAVQIDAPINWSGPSPTSVLHMIEGELTWVETASLSDLKASKNSDINGWRATANQTSFPFSGKLIACDALSRSDIDGVANHIALFGVFPDGFPNAWKAIDNTYIPLPDVPAFKSLYAAMTQQGTENFAKAQSLKSKVVAANSAEDLEKITW